MSVVCPSCGTENRDGARFCKGCGGKLTSGSAPRAETVLASDWSATEPAPLHLSKTRSARVEEERTIIVSPTTSVLPVPDAHSYSPSSHPYSSLPPGPPPPTFIASEDTPRRHPEAVLTLPEPKSSGGFGIGVAVLLVAVLAGAGWYWFAGSGASPQTPVAMAPMATTPAAAGQVEASPAATASVPTATSASTAASTSASAPTQAAIPPAPSPVTVAPADPPAPATQATLARPVGPAPAKLKKAATPPVAVVTAPAAAAIAPTPAPEPPPPPPPAVPQTECAGRNFFAMAQCMVAQCAKPEFKSHPQCEAVRKQQRIDEEKRNPSMAN